MATGRPDNSSRDPFKGRFFARASLGMLVFCILSSGMLLTFGGVQIIEWIGDAPLVEEKRRSQFDENEIALKSLSLADKTGMNPLHAPDVASTVRHSKAMNADRSAHNGVILQQGVGSSYAQGEASVSDAPAVEQEGREPPHAAPRCVEYGKEGLAVRHGFSDLGWYHDPVRFADDRLRLFIDADTQATMSFHGAHATAVIIDGHHAVPGESYRIDNQTNLVIPELVGIHLRSWGARELPTTNG